MVLSRFIVQWVAVVAVCGFSVSASRCDEAVLDLTALDGAFGEDLKTGNIPGGVMVVVANGKIVLARGSGVTSIETKEAVTPDHLFRLGSTTKMIVGATVVALARDGKLSLNEPIGKLIDGLDPRIAALTPHQLLTHTAGMSDEAPMFGRHDESALGDVVRGWKADRLFTEPGDVFSYSNPGYWLAGFAAERAGGKPFADVNAERILRPIGMKRSTFRPLEAMTYPLAQGHDVADGKAAIIRPAANNAATWPAGSLYSSGNELARFVITWLADGKVDDKQVLPAGMFSEMAGKHAVVTAGSYGYGITSTKQGEFDILSHGGARSGFGSLVIMIPKRRIGLILLGNKSAAAFPRTSAKAQELFLGAPAPAKEKPAAKLTAEELKALAGKYRNGSITIELKWKDDRLIGVQGGAEQPVEPIGGRRIRVGTSPAEAVTGKSGKIVYLLLGGRALRKLAAE